ncbi:MAG: tyrosyl-tRNA synthetase [Frankiales bacterium]|jgi:tyrosyl-tRNA synthetase|nr:tyrosyl-tRNA synthetase [Frankiales bacterium]
MARVTAPAPPHELPTVAPVADVLADLEWRGLLAQTTDREALAKELAAGPLTVYCGFDPTADSLHVGSLVPLLALRRFQLAGHRPIALAGGATGFIGDPTGRTTDRVMSSPEEISARVALISSQLERFLSFDDGPTGAVLANNLDWTAPLSVLDFLRDIGRHFPVNQMLARESVSARLESGGLSFTEMSYQLLQSLDFVELYRRYDCRTQIGGNDQWGNITAGLDLLRRTEQASGHALTFPLVTDSAGQKIGKSTGGGNVWLDPDLTSPYALWQFCLNVDDRDAGTYLRLLTFVGREEVEALDRATAERPFARAAQRRLADELVALVHGPAEVVRVQAASAALFGGGALDALDEPTLRAALSEAPSLVVEGESPPVVDLLAAGLGLSKSDARRAVKEGGAYLNNAKVADEAAVPSDEDWLHGRFLVLRKGKRNVLVVERPRS